MESKFLTGSPGARRHGAARAPLPFHHISGVYTFSRAVIRVYLL